MVKLVWKIKEGSLVSAHQSGLVKRAINVKIMELDKCKNSC